MAQLVKTACNAGDLGSIPVLSLLIWHHRAGFYFLCLSFFLSSCPLGLPGPSRVAKVNQVLPAEEGPGDMELLASDLGLVRNSFCEEK